MLVLSLDDEKELETTVMVKVTCTVEVIVLWIELAGIGNPAVLGVTEELTSEEVFSLVMELSVTAGAEAVFDITEVALTVEVGTTEVNKALLLDKPGRFDDLVIVPVEPGAVTELGPEAVT